MPIVVMSGLMRIVWIWLTLFATWFVSNGTWWAVRGEVPDHIEVHKTTCKLKFFVYAISRGFYAPKGISEAIFTYRCAHRVLPGVASGVF